MRTVMAQGTFDLLHPGHVYYLQKSAELGDKLFVVVARDSRVKNRKDLIFDEDERRTMLEALEMVDEAVLGVKDDIYRTVEKLDPDVITLGYDQSHDETEVKELAEEATGHGVEVRRIDEKYDYSSSELKNQE